MDLGCVEFHDARQDPFSDESSGNRLPGNETEELHSGEIRYFAVSCGIGFDAAVCHETFYSPMKKLLNHLKLGKLVYLFIALKQLLSASNHSCELTLDNDQVYRNSAFLFCAFMIHPFEGGGFQFCPEADDQDGLLNLCLIGKLPLYMKLLALPTAFFGKHTLFQGVYQYASSAVSFQSSQPLWVHTDGEVPFAASSVTVSCLPQKLLLML